MEIIPKIESSWQNVLHEEINQPYFHQIQQTLTQDYQAGEIIYPPTHLIFNAFSHTPFHKVKVVILGQDPYHGEAQAHGLSFSVPEGVKIPPSLRNIYKELQYNTSSGNLESWADQGVLLLNAILTVKSGQPASHSKIGWEKFTNSVIKSISDNKEGVIFLLWGSFAQGKKSLIDTSKHYILETSHPSPFSAYRGFLGSGHFEKANDILKKMKKEEIKWKI